LGRKGAPAANARIKKPIRTSSGKGRKEVNPIMTTGIIRKFTASDKATIFKFFSDCKINLTVRLKPIASILPTTNKNAKRGMSTEATGAVTSDNHPRPP
jgi:hypothetical protein